ncbi:helix-turn-helix domain-containing protein [Saccharothrix syringae]|uniref:XRE family transcriptional regulator n=1 Tax=Saccharothrix syringae TaxID=103733 RepID=A0A5Q0GRY5_SACSY|nr:helix-turn-helix transcriptional regulator [Saccharothrix syringae]QFZ16728.1 XRE family transcriptional regulator [Saccharothrix syringae]
MAVEWTRRKARLGEFMKQLRDRVEPRLTSAEVGALTRSNRTTINRLENGLTLPNYHFVVALLGLYRASDEERERATRLYEAARGTGHRIRHVEGRPAKYVAFRKEEGIAVRERSLDRVAVPGPLQTGGYAAAVVDGAAEFAPGHPADWREQAVAERRDRRELLAGDRPLHLHALVDEAVLRRVVGGPAVMREQLDHLLREGRTRDNVTIQVVPFAAGAYGGMSGSAVILDADDEPGAVPTVYLEHAAGGEILDAAAQVDVFVRAFERLSREVALSPERSAELIVAACEALR